MVYKFQVGFRLPLGDRFCVFLGRTGPPCVDHPFFLDLSPSRAGYVALSAAGVPC